MLSGGATSVVERDELAASTTDTDRVARGLTGPEVESELRRVGPNVLAGAEQPHWLARFARNFTHLFALLLWFGAALALLGGQPPLAIAIVAVIVVNAIFSFAQEYRAERAVEALRQILPQRVRVRRECGDRRMHPAGRRARVGPDQLEESDMTTIQSWTGSYLTPSIETATVADAMRVGVMSCEPDAPATAVARMMGTHHIHAVVVEGIHRDPIRGEELRWGVVSDTDLLRAARDGIEGLTAAEIAATEPITVEPSLPLAEAMRLMDEHGTTHLVVADQGRPIGILSTLDVAGVLAWGRA